MDIQHVFMERRKKKIYLDKFLPGAMHECLALCSKDPFCYDVACETSIYLVSVYSTESSRC